MEGPWRGAPPPSGTRAASLDGVGPVLARFGVAAFVLMGLISRRDKDSRFAVGFTCSGNQLWPRGADFGQTEQVHRALGDIPTGYNLLGSSIIGCPTMVVVLLKVRY